MKLPKLILASGSPRRAEILNAVGWDFEKDAADIDETEFPGENPADYVCRLAREKALFIARKHPGQIVLGADTTVVVDDQIIGKPVDMADARRMLGLLSGRTHQVLTGIALVRSGDGEAEVRIGLQRTDVVFNQMSEAELDFLAEYGEPLDKAGAYAVQAQAALFIDSIDGDYWNVVGLPVSLAYRLCGELLGNV